MASGLQGGGKRPAMVAAVWAGQQGSRRRVQVAGEGLAVRGEEEGPRTAVRSTQEMGWAWLKSASGREREGEKLGSGCHGNVVCEAVLAEGS